MQQADYHRHRPTPWMQESVFMHKSPTPLRQSRMNQARSEEEEKERKRDRKDRGQEADRKKGYIYIHGGLAAAKCHGTLDVTRKCQAFKPSLKN